MSSAGAGCDHIVHVSTQIPYSLTAAAVSFVTYLVAGFTGKTVLSLVVGVAVMLIVMYALHFNQKNKTGEGGA